jgi:hypothetical protein
MCIFTLHKKDCQQVPTGMDELCHLPYLLMSLNNYVIHACCYCDRVRLAVTGRSNGRADCIGPLLLWYERPLFTSLHKKRRKMLDISDKVILLWVYKVVNMKYSMRGGTKVLSAVEVILNSNGRVDGIGPLQLWYLCENWYGASPFHFPLLKKIVNRIFSTGSSFYPQLCVSGHMCAHVYQQTHVVSERRTGWSSKLLDIFKQVILPWVYKVVDMRYSRWAGTKVLSVVEAILSSNGHNDGNDLLLLWH